MRGGPAGDLYVFLSIKPHPFFQRDGADLFCRVPISMVTAALSGEITVPVIDGSQTQVRIPAGTQTGKLSRKTRHSPGGSRPRRSGRTPATARAGAW
jgi:molecular chaperone DnaJ